jgi:excisionase family DNA binding protein
MTPTPRPSLTIAEAAALTGLSPSTVKARLRDGQLPGRKVGERWVISRAALEAWMNGESVTRGKDNDELVRAEIERIDIEIQTLEYKRGLYQQRLSVPYLRKVAR